MKRANPALVKPRNMLTHVRLWLDRTAGDASAIGVIVNTLSRHFPENRRHQYDCKRCAEIRKATPPYDKVLGFQLPRKL